MGWRLPPGGKEGGKAEVSDQRFSLGVEEQVPGLHVVVEEPEVVGSCDAAAGLLYPAYDLVGGQPAVAGCLEEFVQAAMSGKLRDNVGSPLCQVGVPDGQDVGIGQPAENPCFDPLSTRP
jgi:hypothetical protein